MGIRSTRLEGLLGEIAQRQAKPADERRRQPRIDTAVPVRQYCDQEMTFQRCLNLSAGGMQLEWGLSLARQTRVELRFALPGEPRLFKMRAEVVANNWEQGRPTTSVRFVEPQGDTQQVIERYVNQRVRRPWRGETPPVSR